MVLKYSFFFNDTATTEIYTLSLHDALPISLLLVDVMREARGRARWGCGAVLVGFAAKVGFEAEMGSAVFVKDRKSKRLNSSHANISYAVFCLEKIIQLYHYPMLGSDDLLTS